MARVKSALRRYTLYNTAENNKNIIEINGLVIDKDEHKCLLYDKNVDLTPMEFEILLYLASNRGKVISSEKLFEEVWKEKYFDSNNTVMVHINKKEINLSYLLEQLVDECYPMLEKNNLKCELNASNKVMYIGDGDKLARAFDNLLKNAINYSYKDTTIEIKLEKIEDKIKISFKNKGDKIPEYKLDKIFEKFYRGDDSRASVTGGSGLGLAITKEIIELHNGTISVKNDDEYIEFDITL